MQQVPKLSNFKTSEYEPRSENFSSFQEVGKKSSGKVRTKNHRRAGDELIIQPIPGAGSHKIKHFLIRIICESLAVIADNYR